MNRRNRLCAKYGSTTENSTRSDSDLRGNRGLSFLVETEELSDTGNTSNDHRVGGEHGGGREDSKVHGESGRKNAVDDDGGGSRDGVVESAVGGGFLDTGNHGDFSIVCKFRKRIECLK